MHARVFSFVCLLALAPGRAGAEDGAEPEVGARRQSQVVLDVGGRGIGLAVLNSTGTVFLPGVGLQAQLGGRVTELVAIVAAVNAEFFGALGVSPAAGLRLGYSHHLTATIGPELLVLPLDGERLRVVGAARLDGTAILVGGLSLQLQLGFLFAATGFTAAFGGVGLGWSLF